MTLRVAFGGVGRELASGERVSKGDVSDMAVVVDWVPVEVSMGYWREEAGLASR